MTEPDLNNVRGALMRKWVLAALGFTALSLYVFAAEILPRYQGALSLRDEWRDRRSVVEGIQAREHNLVNVTAEKQRLFRELESLMVQLAREDEMSAITLTLHDALSERGAVLKQIRPLDAVRGDPYDVLPLSLELEGDFHGLASFVSRLEHAPYLIKVNQLKIEKGKDDLTGHLTLHVVTAGRPAAPSGHGSSSPAERASSRSRP